MKVYPIHPFADSVQCCLFCADLRYCAPIVKSRSVPAQASTCPCGRLNTYETCCGVFHAGTPAPTPEDLMRSRYTAYVLQLGPYLLDTWASQTRPPQMDFAEDGGIKWLGLEVKRAYVEGERGVVEFVARYKVAGRAHRMHETSRFTREADGRWYYVDGEVEGA
ncbi:YchJ family protein [Silvimonas amylolytica]|nr:YchJ family metal-binding protein [Silvimonas amylolytica]